MLREGESSLSSEREVQHSLLSLVSGLPIENLFLLFPCRKSNRGTSPGSACV